MNKEINYLSIKSPFNTNREIPIYGSLLVLSQIQGVSTTTNGCRLKVTSSSFKEPVYIYYKRASDQPENSCVIQIDNGGIPLREIGIPVSGCQDLNVTMEIVDNTPDIKKPEVYLLFRWQ
jgi:hypothetical protein